MMEVARINVMAVATEMIVVVVDRPQGHQYQGRRLRGLRATSQQSIASSSWSTRR